MKEKSELQKEIEKQESAVGFKIFNILTPICIGIAVYFITIGLMLIF